MRLLLTLFFFFGFPVLAATPQAICVKNSIAGRDIEDYQMQNFRDYCAGVTMGQAMCLSVLRTLTNPDWNSFKDYCANFDAPGGICMDALARNGSSAINYDSALPYCSNLKPWVATCIAERTSKGRTPSWPAVKEQCEQLSVLDPNGLNLHVIPRLLSGQTR